jgi:hypothetical protein
MHESWRFKAEVHNNVVDGSRRAPHKFIFATGRSLEVQAAQRAPAPVEGHVALDDTRIESALLEFAAAERAGKEAALVLIGLDIDNEGLG